MKYTKEYYEDVERKKKEINKLFGEEAKTNPAIAGLLELINESDDDVDFENKLKARATEGISAIMSLGLIKKGE